MRSTLAKFAEGSKDSFTAADLFRRYGDMERTLGSKIPWSAALGLGGALVAMGGAIVRVSTGQQLQELHSDIREEFQIVHDDFLKLSERLDRHEKLLNRDSVSSPASTK